MGVSVHALACFPLARFGTDEQRTVVAGHAPRFATRCLLPVGARVGFRRRSLQTQASQVDDGYEITGTKAWISHAGHADFYLVFARTSDTGPRGISCFHVPASTGGVFAQTPEARWACGRRTPHRCSSMQRLSAQIS